MLDRHVIVRDRDRIGELLPGNVADHCKPHAAALGDPEGGLERPLGGVLVEGGDEGDIVVLAEAHLGDACAQIELGHHLGQGRLLGTGDQHCVGGEHGRARRRRKGLAAPGDRDASEGHVHLVEREPVQPGDRVEREHGFRHQLGRGARAREARNGCAAAHGVTDL